MHNKVFLQNYMNLKSADGYVAWLCENNRVKICPVFHSKLNLQSKIFCTVLAAQKSEDLAILRQIVSIKMQLHVSICVTLEALNEKF